jgi:uncharacterized membrane protein
MTTEIRQGRARLLSALLLLGVLIVGGVAGAGVAILLGPRPCPAPAGHPSIIGPFADLGLSADQERRVRAVLEKYRPRVEEVWREMTPRLRAIGDQVEREIGGLLTAEQRRRLDERKAGPPLPPPPPPPGAHRLPPPPR